MAKESITDRQKISGLLHDCVAPYLFISQQQLEMLINTLDEADLSAQQQDMLFKSWRSLNEGYTTLREVMAAAESGAPLVDVQFFPTAEQALRTFTPLLNLIASLPECKKVLESRKLGVCLHELLANVLKHSSEKSAKVMITKDAAHIRLIVESAGNQQKKTKAGMGLSHMATRLKSWGGHLNTQSNKNTYRAEVTLPLKNI